MTCSSEDEKHRCRVCGLWREDPPWGEDCRTPKFRICSCCGTEFGYQDCQMSAIKRQRKRWLNGELDYVDEETNWFVPEERPEDWSVEEQIGKVPEKWK